MPVHSPGVGRRRRFLGTVSVVLSLLTASLMPVASASAATASAAAAKSTSTSTSTAASRAAQSKAGAGTSAAKVEADAAAAKAAAAEPVDVPKKPTDPLLALRPDPRAGHHQTASPRLSTSAAEAAANTAKAKQSRAAAAKNAIAHSTVANTCSGAISPDVVYPCSTPSASGTDTFTVTLTSTTDLLFFEVDSTSANGATSVSLTPPGSATATACPDEMTSVALCATSGAGTYTVQVPSNGVAYTISYLPLLSDTNCTSAGLSFADAPQQSTIAAGTAGICDTLDLASGDVLQYAYDASAVQAAGYSTALALFDSTGAVVCDNGTDPCTLTGTGPYRAIFNDSESTGSTVALQLTSLTNPTGCLAVAQQTYGTVPDSSSTDQCRSISVTKAGAYLVSSTTSLNGATSLYTVDGSQACTNPQALCQLAVGTYYFVEGAYVPFTQVAFGVDFIAADESRGCTATGDTDFATGAVSGTFAGAGQVDCLTLPTASGLSDYLIDLQGAGWQIPMTVLDSTGAQQCDEWYQNNGVCALNGVAPFHVVFSDLSMGSDSYSMLIQRTDSTAGCTPWPQSGFGGSWGVTVKTVAGQANYDCLTIPANQHSTGEMIDYDDTTHTEDGDIYVADPSGAQACLVLNTTVCSYKPGVAYTAILSNSGQAQTYELVRRDVSSSAKCSTPASTVPGGASTPVSLTSTLDTVCYRVTAATTDHLMFSASTPASASAATATLQIADASGAIQCRQWGAVPCLTTGSTSYQVLVTATGYAGATINTQLDTWRVGTASGWASQCTAHQLSTDGWAPFSGAITQSSSGYCAVVSYQPNQEFAAFGNEPPGAGYPWLSMYTTSDWTDGDLGLCNTSTGGAYGFGCQTQGLAAAGQAVLMVTGYDVQFPVPYTFQGVCQFGCTTQPAPATVSAISPASQPARNADQVTVTGTNLTFGTTAALVEAGSAVTDYLFSTPVSVNATGTSLTLDLDTAAVTPGTYDVSFDGAVPGEPGYLTNAYTVTPALPATASSVFALGPHDSSVLQWSGSGTAWTTIGGPASALYVGSAGVFAVTPNGSAIYEYSPDTGAWSRVGGGGAQFAVSGDGLYGLTTNRAAVVRWSGTGTSWSTVGGAAQAIYPAATGVFATSPGNKAIYKYASGSGSWAQVGGAGSQFATSGDELFGLGPNGSYVAEWSGSGMNWSIIGGAAGKIYAGGLGMFAVNPANTAIYQYTTATKAWTKVGAGGAAYAVSQTNLFGESTVGGPVYEYSGTPGSWTNIGANPAAIVGG